MPTMNPDFRDLLATFNARGVEYLVVGAHALAAHGLVRATKDLDVWVRPHPDNARRVMVALSDFGAPLQDLTADDLSRPGLIFQIGVEPIRIDVITAIAGVCIQPLAGTRSISAYDSTFFQASQLKIDGVVC